MAGTFNTTFVTEIIFQLLELNHSAEIFAKLTEYGLRNRSSTIGDIQFVIVEYQIINFKFRISEKGRLWGNLNQYLIVISL